MRVSEADLRVSRIVDQFERTMDENRVIDLVRKLDLEIVRFFEEYDVELDEVDDLKEAIRELKDLIRRYESAQIVLQRVIGDERFAAEEEIGTQKVKRMTDWIRFARVSISERRKAADDELELKDMENKKADLRELEEKQCAQLELEEKYASIKISQLLKMIDINGAVHVEEVEEHLEDLKGVLGEYAGA